MQNDEGTDPAPRTSSSIVRSVDDDSQPCAEAQDHREGSVCVMHENQIGTAFIESVIAIHRGLTPNVARGASLIHPTSAEARADRGLLKRDPWTPASSPQRPRRPDEPLVPIAEALLAHAYRPGGRLERVLLVHNQPHHVTLELRRQPSPVRTETVAPRGTPSPSIHSSGTPFKGIIPPAPRVHRSWAIAGS